MLQALVDDAWLSEALTSLPCNSSNFRCKYRQGNNQHFGFSLGSENVPACWSLQSTGLLPSFSMGCRGWNMVLRWGCGASELQAKGTWAGAIENRDRNLWERG